MASGSRGPISKGDDQLDAFIDEHFSFITVTADDLPQEPETDLEPAAESFRLSAADEWTPTGQRARLEANIAAIETLRSLEAEHRAATWAEQETLAAWSSWGALPEVFDERVEAWAADRDRLHELLSDEEYKAAERTMLNAHYTSPALVDAMWQTAQQLGLREGRVIEPGCGSGNFIGTAPEGVSVVGVELDPLTASIAAHLYPQADVRQESFADTTMRLGAYDAAIGNVPFGQVKLHDPTWNPNGRFSMHNHFIRKSVGGLHEGGIAIMLTSRYTMDARNPALRAELAREADLLGAVRLPNGAHERTAGTDALTDVLVLRKRVEGEAPTEATRLWQQTGTVEVGGESHQVNNYFFEHPENVLGDYSTGGRFNTLTVEAADVAAVPRLLRERLGAIAAEAVENERGYLAPSPEAAAEAESERALETELTPGTVVDTGSGFQIVDGRRSLRELAVPKNAQAELRSLLSVRDATAAAIRNQARTVADTEESVRLREAAHEAWSAHVERFGPVNRFRTTWANVTKKDENGRSLRDPETGELVKERVERRKAPTAAVKLRQDPYWAVVAASERFNEDDQTAEPADILLKRTVTVARPLLGADTADEALQLVLDETGTVDLERIAHRLGTDVSTAREELGELVFDDPAAGGLVTRAEYLSGNVRTKLDEARAAAEAHPEGPWAVNVAALETVLPEDIPLEDIEASIGAVWIDAETHEAFFKEVLGDHGARVYRAGPGMWDVQGGNRASVAATSTYGTERRPAHHLFLSLLRKSEIRVEDKETDGSRVFNATETEAAQAKAAELQERFADWVWEEPRRAARLHAEYNRRFNSLVERDYSVEAEHLRLPGLAADFKPHSHQLTAVARMVAEPSVGLFHEVGAGKTATMIMGVMELKRRGLVSKPAILVPDHMLEQVTREWQQLYPAAHLLSAGADDMKTTDALGKRMFVARAATGDWDGIVMTHGAFKRLDVSAETVQLHTEATTARLKEALAAIDPEAGIGTKRSRKDIENAIAREEARLEKALSNRDTAGLTLEETGIDYLCVDEAHLFKNLHTPSNISGAELAGSQMADDLEMKLSYIRRTYGQRVVTLATGTPIANALTEAYVMQRYLRPDLLEEAGMEVFDDWASTFGEVVTKFERDAAGNFRQKSRFARFKNVPEMMSSWLQFADVKMAEDLDLNVPELAVNRDGQRRPDYRVIARTEAQAQKMAELEKRLSKISGPPIKGADNHFKIFNEGRYVALDPRLVGLRTHETVKLDVVAADTAATWEENKDVEYDTRLGSGETSPNRGSLQVIFCDLSTPKPGRWNAYDYLRETLVTKYGMDAGRIRFIHEAVNDEEKAKLFKQARDGEIDVLIGSTSKMGTGANIQNRLKALRHVDCPWRPADLTQREGRALRQGNQNEEIEIVRYATDDTFDSTSWDIIARKEAASRQIVRGKISGRSYEETGSLEDDAKMLMAKSSGNPLVVTQLELQTEFDSLRRRYKAHMNAQKTLEFRAASADRGERFHRMVAKRLEELDAQSIDTRGEKFRAVIGGRTFEKRAEATAALASSLKMIVDNPRISYEGGHTPDVMQLGGHSFSVEVDDSHTTEAMLRLKIMNTNMPQTEVGEPVRSVRAGQINTLIDRVERKIRSLPDARDAALKAAKASAAEKENAAGEVGKPFKDAQRLEEVKTRLEDVTRKLEEGRRSEETTPVPSAVIRAWNAAQQEPTEESAQRFTEVCREEGIDWRIANNALNNGYGQQEEPAPRFAAVRAAIADADVDPNSGPDLD